MVKQGCYALSVFALSVNSVNAFTQPPTRTRISTDRQVSVSLQEQLRRNESPFSFDPLDLGNDDKMNSNFSTNKAASLLTMATLMMTPEVTNAAGPDWGIFEGRTGSLLHPAMMASMFLFSITTGLLGWQIRRTREIGDEIKELKRAIPKFEGNDLQDAIAKAEAEETVDFRLVEMLKAAVPTQKSINELTAERKTIIANNPRDKHYSQGALLAFLGTAFAIEGPLNTYARAGKLFPGPHLYAGAGLVVLWALAAACVPAMQKGNDTARSIHIVANAAGIGLFGWQVISGWPILLKVIEKTQWP